MDPEEIETAMTAAIATQFPEWAVRVEDYAQKVPGDAIVKFDGIEAQPFIAGDDPRTAVLGATLANVSMIISFITYPQAVRGAMGAVIAGVFRACRVLAQERQQLWRFESATDIAVDEQAEQPVRSIQISVVAEVMIEE